MLFPNSGVLWRGATVIDGIPEMIRELQAKGKNIVLCSNNASKPREKYVSILEKHGVSIPLDNVRGVLFRALNPSTSVIQFDIYRLIII